MTNGFTNPLWWVAPLSIGIVATVVIILSAWGLSALCRAVVGGM